MHPTSQELAPLPVGINYFTYLLGEERLACDTAALTRRFYAASLTVHPDRHATKSALQQALALEHSDYLNRAYRTLKEPWARARYLLELKGTGLAEASHVPPALAEEFFALQEARSEGPEGLAALKELRDRLHTIRQELESRRDQLFLAWDAAGAEARPALLGTLAAMTAEERYLASMQRELENV